MDTAAQSVVKFSGDKIFMATRNRLRDQLVFNCIELAELNFIVDLYPAERRDAIRKFLMNAIADNTIYRSTYMEVYELISREFGYEIPK